MEKTTAQVNDNHTNTHADDGEIVNGTFHTKTQTSQQRMRKTDAQNNIVNGSLNEKLPELDGEMISQHGKINENKPSRSFGH